MSSNTLTSLTDQKCATTIDIEDVTHFLLELDALKRVNRRSYVTETDRRENSAEHSWHLAMACWSIAELFELGVTRSQVAGAHAFIQDSFAPIHKWLSHNIDYATQQGWLIDK